ncbi:hypothetical protein [Rickettsiella endosymbiont of Rhagonycha lignosa]|uniref:hypothetical protein n=1 Tax=Rickettsiella endosymbiont of Rhagonycha lignosa TaxID=3077937 RepID=UPI00313AED6A
MKQEIIEKLKYIITYLGLGNTKEVRNFLKNLETNSSSDSLSTEDTEKFETLIDKKTLELLSKNVIHNDQYGKKFFKHIDEIGCQNIKALLSEKISLNKSSSTHKFFNIPEGADEPIDLSHTGPFGFSIKA